ncbi:hypothetical protein D9M71_654650 [compost metagenome]
MGDRKEDLQQRPIAHLRGVEGHLDGLGMAGIAPADLLIVGRVGTTPGVPGDGPLDPFDVLENALHAPEAATGKHGRLGTSLAGGLVQRRRGQGNGRLTERPGMALASQDKQADEHTRQQQMFHEAFS